MTTKTQLFPEQFVKSQRLHRDVLAHHLRWTYLAKQWAHWRDVGIVVDVGCGKGCPLAWALYTNRCAPKLYVGLDIRELASRKHPDFLTLQEQYAMYSYIVAVTEFLRQQGTVPNKDWVRVWDKVDVTDVETMINVQQTYGPVTAVVCLEVLEHLPRDLGVQLLEGLHVLALAQQDGPEVSVYLSTPVFNGRHAGHHPYEWKYAELQEELDKQGFLVREHWGTFASQKDIVPVLTEAELIVFHAMKKYYSADLLSILFAPMHPAESRNVLWHLVRKK